MHLLFQRLFWKSPETDFFLLNTHWLCYLVLTCPSK